ncbi:MAG: uncharacterized protein KVP18_003119 [Porospora cf. gigantea A]|uniref:uncharacterized protein n=1 Tax=Porospora cf. gigantea A TaxID=2853593 RepID=UPI00355A197D|nr:MAG: hypothetical protein KVP18_003119 [Porospora cf. gigantea A]
MDPKEAFPSTLVADFCSLTDWYIANGLRKLEGKWTNVEEILHHNDLLKQSPLGDSWVDPVMASAMLEYRVSLLNECLAILTEAADRTKDFECCWNATMDVCRMSLPESDHAASVEIIRCVELIFGALREQIRSVERRRRVVDQLLGQSVIVNAGLGNAFPIGFSKTETKELDDLCLRMQQLSKTLHPGIHNFRKLVL